MNSFEINKILGAILGTCLVLVAVHIAAGAVFEPRQPAKPGYEIAVKEEAPAAGSQNAPAEQPIENLLASASAERGAQTARQCQACHNFQEGQGPKVGPDLYGVVDRPIASASGFNYSGALKSKKGKWDFDTLNKWLTKPSAFAPGTAMTFAGLSNEKQRADVIAYLDSLAANPVPLPKPQAQSSNTQPSSTGPGPSPPAGAPGNPPPSAAPAAGAPANSAAPAPGASGNNAAPAPANGGAPSQQ